MKNNRIILLVALFATAVMSWGQDIHLTANGDGTWTLASMPAYDISLQVEYENDSIPPATDDIILTANSDGTWTLSAMPAHDVLLVVEYENDSIPPATNDIILTANGDGTWTLAAMPGYDVSLEVEYEDVEIVAIDSETTVNPGETAEPGKAVTSESGVTTSLDSTDEVDPVEGSVTMHSTTSPDEVSELLATTSPGSEDFYETYKGLSFMLAPGKGKMEFDIETKGNYLMCVSKSKELIGTYTKSTKGTIVLEYDIDTDTWFFAYPSVSTPSGVRRAKINDTDGSLKVYGIKIIPEEIYDPDGIDSLTPDPSPMGDESIYNLGGQRISNPQKGIYIIGGKKILVK